MLTCAWYYAGKLVPSSWSYNSDFGRSVALDDGIALIGAPYAYSSGLAFEARGLGDCNRNGATDACDILAGRSTDGNQDGLPDECAHIGDMNCDGVTDLFDIDPFALALADADGYAAAYPNCDRTRADANFDGVVDLFDIDPFVQLLTGG